MTLQPGERALVLSGGGARAAYQVGVLKALAEVLPDGCANPFGIICGTSAGAINAVKLAAHDGCFDEAVADLVELWQKLKPEDIYRHGWGQLITGSGRIFLSLFNRGMGVDRPLSLLDNSPLETLLRSNIDVNQIDRNIARGSLTAISVTAMGFTSGRSVTFFQSSEDIEGWQRNRRVGRRCLIHIDHLMASSAIPTLFPATKIEHEYFGDGALRQIAPISPALHLGAENVFIIGVSGNRRPTSRNRPAHVSAQSPSIAQVIGHMLNSAFIDSLEEDIDRLARTNDLLSYIPTPIRDEKQLTLREIENFVVSPTAPLDAIASRHVQHLPASVRFLLRATGATASAGGIAAASYLLFTPTFISELIELGYKDAMWDMDKIREFLNTDTPRSYWEASIT